MILPDTDIEGAAYFAERLRSAVEAFTVNYNETPIRFTISLGLAQLDPAEGKYERWLERADKALYRSKEEGRNRVSHAV